MKIILIGEYPLHEQQSMSRFGHLLENCLTVDHDILYINAFPVFGRLRRSPSGFGKWLSYLDRFVLYPVYLLLRLPSADVVHILDQANAPYAHFVLNSPTLVTCHDMLAVRAARGEISSNRTGPTGRIFQRWILKGLCRADGVVCVSEQTETEWLRICPQSASKTSTVYNSLNFPYSHSSDSETTDQTLQRLGIRTKSYILHVGDNSWYKNRAGVVRIFSAMRLLPHFRRHILVFAGQRLPRDLRLSVEEAGLMQHVVEAGSVDNEDLRILYSSATLLLFPSLAEGFGWPIIEAQACGCLVATTDRAPMSEVGGNGAIYINPSDCNGAARTIADCLPNKDELIARGYANVERYSLAGFAAGYICAYKAAIAAYRTRTR